MSTPARHALALGLVAAFVGSNLLGLAHQAAERHARCAEHGEPVHLEQDRVELSDGAGESDRVRSTTTSLEDGHDHCVVMSHVRERPSATTSASEALPAPAGARIHLAAARSVPGAAAVLRLAPKTSPPA